MLHMRKINTWLLVVCLAATVLVLASCDQKAPPAPPRPAPAPSQDSGSAPAAPAPAPAPEPAPPPFDKPTIQPVPGLTAARNLTGTWRGTGVDYQVDGGNNFQRFIRVTWDVTLVLNQTGNTVAGNMTAINVKQEVLVGVNNWPVPNEGPNPLANGVITSSQLFFDAGGARWEFSFTEDLMSGQYSVPGVRNSVDAKAFVLHRQR